MKLSHEEEVLRHWMHDEWHFREGTGPAKRLQVSHQVRPFELALIISVSMTEPEQQLSAAEGPPPPEPPVWPWTVDSFQRRLAEARALLESPRHDSTSAA